MPPAPNRTCNLANVRGTVTRVGKKMKDSTVMPHITSGRGQLDFSDVGD